MKRIIITDDPERAAVLKALEEHCDVRLFDPVGIEPLGIDELRHFLKVFESRPRNRKERRAAKARGC